jgi:D-psicose/D-tagatose/L-ribulose 3-epimerase
MDHIGVIASPDRLPAARASGAHHIEPPIVGGLVHPDGDGWAIDPAYDDGPYPSFSLLFPGDVPLSDPRVPTDAAHDYLEAVLPLVASVAAPGAIVVFGSGTARRVPEGVDRTAAANRFASVVELARDHADAHDLRVVLEPLNGAETDMVNSITEAVRFLDEHDIEGVDVVADLHHIVTEGEPLAVVAEHVDRIGHVHLADGGRRYIGAGGNPWPELLDVLAAGGYTGLASLECAWGDDFAGELATSLELVRAHR